MSMIRKILYTIGVCSWCEAEGVHRHYNEGFRKIDNDNTHIEMVCIGDNIYECVN